MTMVRSQSEAQKLLQLRLEFNGLQNNKQSFCNRQPFAILFLSIRNSSSSSFPKFWLERSCFLRPNMNFTRLMAPFLNITFDRPFFLFIYDALNKVWSEIIFQKECQKYVTSFFAPRLLYFGGEWSSLSAFSIRSSFTPSSLFILDKLISFVHYLCHFHWFVK